MEEKNGHTKKITSFSDSLEELDGHTKKMPGLSGSLEEKSGLSKKYQLKRIKLFGAKITMKFVYSA